MARYVPKHMRKRTLRDHRRATGIAAVVLAGVASLSGSFGYTPGALAVDPSKPLAEQVAAITAGSDNRPAGTSASSRRPSGFDPGRPLAIRVTPADPAIDVANATKPLYVNIPAIGVGSELIELGIDQNDELEVPVDFNQAGWFKGGAIPGDVGPAVIAGHLDSILGPAIFSKLSLLKPGDVVKVLRRDSKVLTFAVTRIDSFPKEYFPTDQVYGSTTEPELRLITCGGTFNAKERSYTGNTVVYARLVPDPAESS